MYFGKETPLSDGESEIAAGEEGPDNNEKCGKKKEKGWGGETEDSQHFPGGFSAGSRSGLRKVSEKEKFSLTRRYESGNPGKVS